MRRIAILFTLLIAGSSFLPGCTGSKDGGKDDNKNSAAKSHDGNKDEHAGSHTAPHGGILVELGSNHAYHAEVKDDHKIGATVVYIMDGKMKPLKIKETSVTLVVTDGDKSESFTLTTDSKDGSDMFQLKDAKLHNMMHGKEVSGKLKVTIDGKQYNGKVDFHDHSKEGHDKDGEDHSGHSHS